MTKWVIRALHEDGYKKTAEIETDVEIAGLALDLFEVKFGWACWVNIDIDRVED